ncbi:exodeoxyribonuclease-3 [Sinobacterium caligoides]|uniref:Exodeoxyribonuclease-3 n=1 Tax=Sinobacterium caligoides TaxID=933926 RepID=A0A3N2DH14_9GAMM|nr:exodeoxyribonuclease III [Sinobacterium caligoides]ROR99096.1 exodeoxyribonuclease-3 [Sinobacterium caligoides]
MRIISFCADGIKQATQNGFFEWVVEQDADIICIQDLRCQEYDLTDNVFFPEGYYGYFFDSPSGVNGVAIYVRQIPKAIMTGLGFGESDMHARYIQADYDNISIGCILAPDVADGSPTAVEEKAVFFDQLAGHLNKIRNKRREFIICGNWQMAHQDIDLQSPEDNEDCSGFLPFERQWMDNLYHELGYIDAFRTINNDSDEFTWWPNGERGKNGWRVDLQVISNGMRSTVEYGAAYKSKEFSSHAPLIMDYDYELISG